MRIYRRLTILLLGICLTASSASAATAASAAKAAVKAGETYKVTASSLKVRSEPNTKARVVGGLKSGETVKATKAQDGWLRIQVGKLTGWVSADYLEPTSGGAAAAEAGSGAKASGTDTAQPAAGQDGSLKPEAAASEPEAPQEDEALTAQGIEAEEAGEPEVDAAAADADADAQEPGSEPADEAPEPGRTGVVTADALRIRSGPGTAYKIAGVLYQGESATVVETAEGWLKIESAGGMIGWVSADYIAFGKDAEQAQKPKSSVLQGKTIVIDPGHGGNDPGMVGTKHGTYEKTLNLSTSMYLVEELEQLGANVVLTRTKDEEKPGLAERVRIAEQAGADAFVSVHYNSSPKKVSGTLTFYYDAKKDKPLAAAIEKRLQGGETGLASNGFAYGNYHVLRENDVPAALVELGFLTNEKDEELVLTEAYQRAAAKAVALGLMDYLKS